MLQSLYSFNFIVFRNPTAGPRKNEAVRPALIPNCQWRERDLLRKFSVCIEKLLNRLEHAVLSTLLNRILKVPGSQSNKSIFLMNLEWNFQLCFRDLDSVGFLKIFSHIFHCRNKIVLLCQDLKFVTF